MTTKCLKTNCHFDWKYEEDLFQNDPAKNLQHLQETIKTNPEVQLIAGPTISYFHCMTNPPDYRSALKNIDNYLQNCDKVLHNPEEKFGYKSVALEDKAHILKLSGREQEAFQVMDSIKDLGVGTKISIGIRLGLRAFFLSLFGVKNYQKGCQLYKEAMMKDEKTYYWPFGKAYLSQKYRRSLDCNRFQPNEEELSDLYLACELSGWKKPIAITLLADGFFQRGRKNWHLRIRQPDEELFAKARGYFQMALKLAPDSLHVLVRAGKALAKMGDRQAGLNYLLHAAELDPQNYRVFHRLGQIYETGGQREDLLLAEKYYEKSVTIGRRRNGFAECDLGRIRKQLNPNYDLLQHYRAMKPHYEHHQQFLDIIEKEIANLTI